MKRVDVIWLVEHIARELDVACAVRYYLQNRYRISVKIVPMWHTSLFYLAQRYSPKVVAIPYAYGTRWGNMPRYLPSWREAIVVNLAWEQLYENAYHDLKRPEDEFVKNHVIHHAWGNFFKDYLIESGVPEQHIFVNGHPAFKLYDLPYNRVYKNRARLAREFNLDSDRRWVFFPESYSWAFRNEKWIKTQVRWGVSIGEIVTCQDYCTSSLPIVLQWIRRLAEAGPVEVIVRPRPSTSKADFLNFAQNVKGDFPANVHFNQRYSIREWILASDLVVSSHSTSLLEASVAGRPAYMIGPYPLPEPMKADWMTHAQKLTTEEAFIETCLALSESTEPNPLATWARSELLSHGDPITRLAEHIYKLCRPNAPRPPLISAQELEQIIPHGYSRLRDFQALPIKEREYRWLWNYWNQARKQLRKKIAGPPGALRDHFSQLDVVKRTMDFRRALGSSRDVSHVFAR